MIRVHPAVAAAGVLAFSCFVFWSLRADYAPRGRLALPSAVLQFMVFLLHGLASCRTSSGVLTLAASLCVVAPCQAGEIHDAARSGDLGTLEAFLAAAPEQVNARDVIGHTPLTLAAAYGRWEVFRFLVANGADVNVVTYSGQTPLHCACQHDLVDMVELLFKRGAGGSMGVRDVFGGYTPMLRAVQRGNGNVVSFLFRHGALPDETTVEGWNALHLAAKCGHRHLYGLLIGNKVSLDSLDHHGKRPLEYDNPRPATTEMDATRFKDYVGWFSWEGAPEGLGVGVRIENGELLLDDHSLNRLQPIAEDTFFCSNDPWRVQFLRDRRGSVSGIELTFLRRSVTLERVR
jgi:hypothetical protein